jgi:hypothetical protein
MPNFQLIAKLRELCQSNATLLWLEGSQTERVLSVRYQSGRIVLRLGNGTNRVVAFDRFTITAVGLQFWSQGHPGVLYKWDQVDRNSWKEDIAADGNADFSPEDPPPNLAA